MEQKAPPAQSGEKTLAPNKARQIISAGIIVFRKTKDGVKYLLLYHGRDYWNFPKGKLEQSERSMQAALREVREETGLKSTELKLIGNFKTFEKFYYRRGNEKIFKVVILYLAETRQSQITVSDEHEGYGWFRFNEAKKMLSKYKDGVKILQRVQSYLLHHSGRTTPSPEKPLDAAQ